MIDFPIAWCSDDASWLAFSKKQGLLTIQEANVLWRRGSFNITPSGSKYQNERIDAAFKFIEWLNDYCENITFDNQKLNSTIIKKLSKTWFLQQLRGVTPFKISNYAKFAYYLDKLIKKGQLISFIIIFNYDLRFYLKNFIFLKKNNDQN